MENFLCTKRQIRKCASESSEKNKKSRSREEKRERKRKENECGKASCSMTFIYCSSCVLPFGKCMIAQLS